MSTTGKGVGDLGKAARLKKERAKLPAPKPMDPVLIEAYNRGRAMGCKVQHEANIEQLVKVLQGIEEIPGIGEKTAWKVREFFLKQFGATKS
nr:hypothetical protein [Heyndrickxia oleronia]